MSAVSLVIRPTISYGGVGDARVALETWYVAVVKDDSVVWATERWSETGARHAVAFWLSRYSRQLRLQAALGGVP